MVKQPRGDVDHVLKLAAAAEMATGLALIAVPSVVGQLLLGVALAGPAATVAGVLGLALLGLASLAGQVLQDLACWSTARLPRSISPMPDFRPPPTGPLLWPVVVLHGLAAIVLLLTWKRYQSDRA